jgi:hypothetical protein
MQGRLKNALRFGTFSCGLISRGVYSNERVTIGFMSDSLGKPNNNVGRFDIRALCFRGA